MVFALDETFDTLAVRVGAQERTSQNIAPADASTYLDHQVPRCSDQTFTEFANRYPRELQGIIAETYPLDPASLAFRRFFGEPFLGLEGYRSRDIQLPRKDVKSPLTRKEQEHLSLSPYEYVNFVGMIAVEWGRFIGSALHEAVLNGWWHGNALDECKKIRMTRSYGTRGLVYVVADEGAGFDARAAVGAFHRGEKYCTKGGCGFAQFHRTQAFVTFNDQGNQTIFGYQCRY